MADQAQVQVNGASPAQKQDIANDPAPKTVVPQPKVSLPPRPDVSASPDGTNPTSNGSAAPQNQATTNQPTQTAKPTYYFLVEQQQQLEQAEAKVKQAQELIDNVKKTGALTGGLDTNPSDKELLAHASKVAHTGNDLAWRELNSKWIAAHKNDSDLNLPSNWDSARIALKCDYIKKESIKIAQNEFGVDHPRDLARQVVDAMKVVEQGVPPQLQAIRELEKSGAKVEFRTAAEMAAQLNNKKPEAEQAPAVEPATGATVAKAAPTSAPHAAAASQPSQDVNISPEMKQRLAQLEQETQQALAKEKAEKLTAKVVAFREFGKKGDEAGALAMVKAMSPEETQEFKTHYDSIVRGGMKADIRQGARWSSKEWDPLIGPDTVDTVGNRFYMRQVNGSVPESGPISTQELATTLVKAIQTRNKMAAFSIVNGRSDDEIARLDAVCKEQNGGKSIKDTAATSYWTADDRAMLDARLRGFDPMTHADEIFSAVDGGGTTNWKVHYSLVGLRAEQSVAVYDKYKADHNESMVYRLMSEMSGGDLSHVKNEIPFAYDPFSTAQGIRDALDNEWGNMLSDDDTKAAVVIEALTPAQVRDLDNYMANDAEHGNHSLKHVIQTQCSEGAQKTNMLNKINEAQRLPQ